MESFAERDIFLSGKEGKNFNRRNTLSISRIALKVSADASLRVTACQNLKPDAASRTRSEASALKMAVIQKSRILAFIYEL